MSIVFLFPGQGSQTPNMLADFAQDYPKVLDTFAEASEAVGFDIWQVCNDEEKISQTQYTQPALLTVSIALWRLWKSVSGKTPKLLAGHSLGEYSALVASEVLSLTDAVQLVHQRGLLMQQAVPIGVGAMAAIIGKSPEQVAEYCATVSDEDFFVSPANFNCQGQVVVSGHRQAVDKLTEFSQEAGFKMMALDVSVPSHCKLMLPASEQLAEALKELDFRTAKIPVIQNLTGTVNTDSEAIKQALIAQLSEPVQWQKTMQYIQGQGMTSGVECGSGKILSGLAKRQKLDFNIYNTATVADFNMAVTKV